MEFGIIAEGKGDCAVLQNILMGIFDELDEEDIRFLRPEFNLDNTDKVVYSDMSANEFGSWTLVKKDCIDQEKFKNFLNSPIAGERFIIIQIDTAECEQTGYDIKRPSKKNENYCDELVKLVSNRIDEWLENSWTEKVHYAICIEEMEAWIHALYENKDTSKSLDAKETFNKNINRRRRTDKKWSKNYQKASKRTEFDKAHFLSKDFQKIAKKTVRKALENNDSLKIFVLSLEELRV